MELTIVIVNYNVKYFLEHCLLSVKRATENITSEIIVVDNNSEDGSVEMLRTNFPEVILIENKENHGFSKANNQAIDIAKGEFVLLLNPDTLVGEQSLSACLNFMASHPQTGALGVKMIDGQGKFLPESKRSFPSPAVSFYKLFGLSTLFPKSNIFGKYHLSYLSPEEITEVDVLSGAFMFLRKLALIEVGKLDEDYFMYGEDIDLSFKLKKAGYKIYYFAETTILHYKGESTKKNTYKYVKHFYKSMGIFANKHLAGNKAAIFSLGIKTAILFRALLSVLGRGIKFISYVLIYGLVAFGGLVLIKNFWSSALGNITNYPKELLYINFPVYISIWLIASYFGGVFDRPFKPYRLIRGILLGTILIAIVYAFLPESLRFSRILILLGAMSTFFLFFVLRLFEHFIRYRSLDLAKNSNKRLAIVANLQTGRDILSSLNALGIAHNYIGLINPYNNGDADDNYIGTFQNIPALVKALSISELIFCDNNIQYNALFSTMTELAKQNVNIKITHNAGKQMLGSSSKNTAGDFYAIDISPQILNIANKRNKRLFDLIAGIGILVLSPVLFWMQQSKKHFFDNLFKLLVGEIALVSLEKKGSTNFVKQLKPGILSPVSHIDSQFLTNIYIERENINYARDYHVNDDIAILFKNLNKLG